MLLHITKLKYIYVLCSASWCKEQKKIRRDCGKKDLQEKCSDFATKNKIRSRAVDTAVVIN